MTTTRPCPRVSSFRDPIKKKAPPSGRAFLKAAAEREPLIANKQFYVGAEKPAKLVTDPKLMDHLIDHYLAMCPLNEWLAVAMK